MDLSRGSVSHKGTPTSILLKHSQRVLLLGHQVSSVNTITVTLAPGSTKEFLHEGWGSTHPPHKDVDAAPHQAGGSLTLPASHQDSKDDRHTKHKLEQHSSTAHKTHNLALTLKIKLA